jgi:predicted transcriptional regulator
MAFSRLFKGVTEVRYFKRQPDNRRSVYLELTGSIESQLRQAYAKRHESAGVTQASLADKIGVGRSVVHRRLTGRSNMTTETISDLVWALGHCIKVDIFDPDEIETNDFMIKPETVTETGDGENHLYQLMNNGSGNPFKVISESSAGTGNHRLTESEVSHG